MGPFVADGVLEAEVESVQAKAGGARVFCDIEAAAGDLVQVIPKDLAVQKAACGARI